MQGLELDLEAQEFNLYYSCYFCVDFFSRIIIIIIIIWHIPRDQRTTFESWISVWSLRIEPRSSDFLMGILTVLPVYTFFITTLKSTDLRKINDIVIHYPVIVFL